MCEIPFSFIRNINIIKTCWDYLQEKTITSFLDL